jgi:hypothetical protein
LHIRLFDLKDNKDGPVTESDVPWYAIHVPSSLSTRLLFQGAGA